MSTLNFNMFHSFTPFPARGHSPPPRRGIEAELPQSPKLQQPSISAALPVPGVDGVDGNGNVTGSNSHGTPFFFVN